MLEFLLCSLVTILPDFLFRRYGQNRRWGIEINYFSVWYELRWGITTCVLLTVALITLIFYYHPSTTNVTPIFRTVSILPEFGGRVEEVYVDNLQEVEAGEALFSMSGVSELAAVDTAFLPFLFTYLIIIRSLSKPNGRTSSFSSSMNGMPCCKSRLPVYRAEMVVGLKTMRANARRENFMIRDD